MSWVNKYGLKLNIYNFGVSLVSVLIKSKFLVGVIMFTQVYFKLVHITIFRKRGHVKKLESEICISHHEFWWRNVNLLSTCYSCNNPT